MVVETLGATVVSILVPLVAKKAEEFIAIAGQAAYDKAKKLFATLKARWAGDKEATDQLAYFEKNPKRYQPAIEDILKDRLSKDKNLAAELNKIVKEMGPELTIVQEMEEAEGLIGLKSKHFIKGKVKIRTTINKKGKDVTGADIDIIG